MNVYVLLSGNLQFKITVNLVFDTDYGTLEDLLPYVTIVFDWAGIER